MIICCGMGGSSVAGELLSFARPDVIVHWDWNLPSGATPNDRVVCTSWSGNTAETISSYDAARTAGIPASVITTGGALAEKARADGVPLALLADTHTPPRENAISMTSALFRLLGMGELPVIDVAAAQTAGAQLASEIGTKIPIFYAGYPWRKVAGFFKTTVNENAKRHSWAANFPSAAHNEIVGWTAGEQQHMVPVLIRDPGQRSQDTRDGKALVALLGEMEYIVSTVELVGATTLEKALNAYVMALWASSAMATAAHIESTDTTLIEKFKHFKTAA